MAEGLKAGWRRVKFGDVVRLNKDSSRDPAAEGLERYVGLEHIEPGDLRIRSWGDIADGTSFTNRFRPGQVLFGKRRAYQRKVAVADFDGVCSGDIYVFEPKDPGVLLPELLPFLCQTDAFFDYAVGTSAGSLSPRTNWKSLALYEFALPPLEEQRRILSMLRVFLESINAAYGLIVETEKLHLAIAKSGFDELRKSNVPFVQFNQLCSRQPQSGLYKSKECYGTGFPMVHMGELFAYDEITASNDMQRVDVENHELSKYRLTNNDLLFGRRSIVLEGAGRCVVVGELSESVTFESSIVRVTADSSKVSNRFLFEWFRSPEGARSVQSFVTFTTVAGIKGSDIAS